MSQYSTLIPRPKALMGHMFSWLNLKSQKRRLRCWAKQSPLAWRELCLVGVMLIKPLREGILRMETIWPRLLFPLLPLKHKEKKKIQKKEKKYKSPSLRDLTDRVGVSHCNRDRTIQHLGNLSKLQHYKKVPHHFFLCFHWWWHSHKPSWFNPRCFFQLIFLSELLTGSHLVEVLSVNPKPWRFTNNNLGLPHAHSLSVCLYLWVCVLCVCFLLYLSFYLCCVRCVFCVLFCIHCHLFVFFFLCLQI